MAVIANSSIASGVNAVTATTLGASDTFVYVPLSRQLLLLSNDTGGSLTVTIDGAGATTQSVSGVGSVDLSGGFSTGAIATGTVKAIPLDSIKSYLVGTIAVTGGTGIVARLLTF
tara:strand:+ start:1799 stop:2143 length:345 start_codon:yes stop_codon:yes gene_type:complete